MVALPGGTFLMGEEGVYGTETPLHEVTISTRFAIGRYPVTFAEYDHFCHMAKRGEPFSQGWGRGRRPVINVSWNDAREYVAWLSEATGQPYRLPSEAEWEYAARAGTTTSYAFGYQITEEDANFGRNVGKTTEVGAYPPNAWRLYDIHGNVCEWVADHWHNSYNGAPTDGSPWIDARAEAGAGRVHRGGSWLDYELSLRSAYRDNFEPGLHGGNLGFRCARSWS